MPSGFLYTPGPSWTPPTDAAAPSLAFEIAPTGGVWDSSPTWVDITTSVMDWEVTLSGRQREFENVQAGSGRLHLLNINRSFDPTYTSGPYYPFHAYIPFRLRATYNSTTYDVFRGFCGEWRVNWEVDWGSSLSTTEVELTDAIAVTADWQVGGTVPQATAGERIADVLTWGNPSAPPSAPAGWYAGYLCQAKTYDTGTTMWSAINEAVATGSADVPLFFDAAGNPQYMRGTTSDYIFGDLGDGREIPYSAAGLPYGPDQFYSQVKVTRAGGTEQIVGGTDGSSGARRTYTRDTINVTDGDARSLAQDIYNMRSAPTTRPENIVVKPATDGDLCWTPVLTLGQEDNFLLRRRPPGGGLFEQAQRVLSISHRGSKHISTWQTTYRTAGGHP